MEHHVIKGNLPVILLGSVKANDSWDYLFTWIVLSWLAEICKLTCLDHRAKTSYIALVGGSK